MQNSVTENFDSFQFFLDTLNTIINYFSYYRKKLRTSWIEKFSHTLRRSEIIPMTNRDLVSINRFPHTRNVSLFRRISLIKLREWCSSLIAKKEKLPELILCAKSHLQNTVVLENSRGSAASRRVNICATTGTARDSPRGCQRSSSNGGADSIVGFHRNCRARVALPYTVSSGSIILTVSR